MFGLPSYEIRFWVADNGVYGSCLPGLMSECLLRFEKRPLCGFCIVIGCRVVSCVSWVSL